MTGPASEHLPRRRACLVVPGSSPDKLAKAVSRGADEIVIDLEDAVLPQAKATSRSASRRC
jgi:citrate lyase beta subunit